MRTYQVRTYHVALSRLQGLLNQRSVVTISFIPKRSRRRRKDSPHIGSEAPLLTCGSLSSRKLLPYSVNCRRQKSAITSWQKGARERDEGRVSCARHDLGTERGEAARPTSPCLTMPHSCVSWCIPCVHPAPYVHTT